MIEKRGLFFLSFSQNYIFFGLMLETWTCSKFGFLKLGSFLPPTLSCWLSAALSSKDFLDILHFWKLFLNQRESGWHRFVLSNICKNSDQYATNSLYNKFFFRSNNNSLRGNIMAWNWNPLCFMKNSLVRSMYTWQWSNYS